MVVVHCFFWPIVECEFRKQLLCLGAAMVWQDIYGWSDDIVRFYKQIVDRYQSGDIFVELGCWLGRSTCALAQFINDSGKDITFFAIDHGIGSDEEIHRKLIRRYDDVIAVPLVYNIVKCGVRHRVNFIMADAIKISKFFQDNSLAFVFLDDAHTSEHIQQEIDIWRPKIRDGGIIAGHDYYSDNIPGWVRGAVNHKFQCRDEALALHDGLYNSCWAFVRQSDRWIPYSQLV